MWLKERKILTMCFFYINIIVWMSVSDFTGGGESSTTQLELKGHHLICCRPTLQFKQIIKPCVYWQVPLVKD